MPNYSDLIVEESYDLLDLAYACEEYGYPSDTSDMISEIATEAVEFNIATERIGSDEWFLKVAERVAEAKTPEKKEAILSAAASTYNPMSKYLTTKDGIYTDLDARRLRAGGMHNEIIRRLGKKIPSTPYPDQFKQDAKGILREYTDATKDLTKMVATTYNNPIKSKDLDPKEHSQAMRSMQRHRDRENKRNAVMTKVELHATKDALKAKDRELKHEQGLTDDLRKVHDNMYTKLEESGKYNHDMRVQMVKDEKFRRNTKIGIIALAVAAAAVGGAMLLKKHKAKAAARKADLSRTKYFKEHNVSDDKKDDYIYKLRKTIISDISKIIDKLKSDKNLKASGVNIIGRSSGIENVAFVQVIEKNSSFEVVQSVMKALKDKYVDECEAGILSIGYTEDKTGIKIIVK